MIRLLALGALWLTTAAEAPRHPMRAPSCADGREVSTRYFGGTGLSDHSGVSDKLCRMAEPSLLHSPARAVRCTYEWSFLPTVSIRLEEGSCTAEVSVWDNVRAGFPQAHHTQRKISPCEETFLSVLTDKVPNPSEARRITPEGEKGGRISLERHGAQGVQLGQSNHIATYQPSAEVERACDLLARAAGFSPQKEAGGFDAVTLFLRGGTKR